ncbi:MAG: prephenate dehydrogenase/arogenate dehydrogenase family protein [Candidatus Caldarchaeum sp.]|nr:prephenate dehydrogenase/arogenate dehydrogenase family protein [Candidatus Caldarchaeum sp.]
MQTLGAAVIGAGPMGLWTANHLARRGYSVRVYDIKGEKINNIPRTGRVSAAENFEEAVKHGSVIFSAVGTKNSSTVIRKIITNHQEKIVVDISSVKTPVVKSLEKVTTRNNLVVLTHPLFGPGTKKLEDKTVLFVPFRKKASEYRICKALFSPCRIVTVSAAQHDRMMAAAMALPRAFLLTMLDVWRRAGVEDLTFSQRAIRLAASTILTENPSLAVEIIAYNPYSTLTIKQALTSVKKMVQNPSENIKNIYTRLKTKTQKREYIQIYSLLEKSMGVVKKKYAGDSS